MDTIDREQADKEQLEKFLEAHPENDEALTVEQRLGFLRDDTQALQRDVTEILSLLRPLAPALRALPEVVEQVGPIIDGLKKSPVLKALGVRIP